MRIDRLASSGPTFSFEFFPPKTEAGEENLRTALAELRGHGAELLGEVAQYESIFLLCYLRGPAGIIVALAEQIG